MEHISFRRNGKEFEPTKAELKMVLDDHAHRLAITEKALEMAVADKCKFENALLSKELGVENVKLSVPKKELWYKEQAEKEMMNGY